MVELLWIIDISLLELPLSKAEGLDTLTIRPHQTRMQQGWISV